MRILCKECVYLEWCQINKYMCTYDKNVKKICTWLEEITRYKEKPDKLNKDNDCKWFRSREQARIDNAKVLQEAGRKAL